MTNQAPGELATKVHAAWTGETFSLSLPSLGSPALSDLAERYFPGSALVLSAVGAPEGSPVQESVTVRGTGVDLPFAGMAVEAVFSMVDGNAALQLTATAVSGWTFTGAFAALSTTLASELRFLASPAPQLVLRSHAGTGVEAGLSFTGTLNLAAMTGGLSGFIGLSTQLVTGTVEMRKHAGEVVALALTAPAAQQVNLGVATVDELDFAVGGTLAYNPLTHTFSVSPYLGLSATLVFEAQGRSHTLPIAARIHGLTGAWRFTAEITGAIAAAWDELSWLAGDVGIGGLVPPGMHLDDVLLLQGLFFDVDPSLPSTVALVGVEVGNPTPWTLARLPGSGRELRMNPVRLRVSVLQPFGTPLPMVTVMGELAMGAAGTLVAFAHAPGFSAHAGLKEGTVLRMDELIADFAGADTPVPALTIDDLRLDVDGTNLSVGMELTGLWTSGTSLAAIEEVRCSVKHTPGETRVEAEGRMWIGGVQVFVSGVHPGAGRGWKFEGSTGDGQTIAIGTLASDLATRFGAAGAVPASLSGAVITNLHVAFDTGTKAFSFSGETKLELDASHELDLVVVIDLQPSGTGYRRSFRGILTLGDLEFGLAFDQDTTATRVAASYHDLAGGTVNLGTLVASISSDDELVEVAENLEITLRDALFAWRGASGTDAAAFVLGADVGGGVNLSNLPLVGRALPDAQSLRLAFRPLIASRDLAQTEVAALRALVPAGGLELPEGDLDEGLSLATTLQIGGTTIDLSLPVGMDTATGNLTDASTNPSQPAALDPEGSVSTPDGVSWMPVQKSFGPLQLQRVGVRYKGGALWFYLDASLTAAGLTLSLDGLGAGITLAQLNTGTLSPQFSLRGLGIGYDNGQVQVGGFLLRMPAATAGGADEYDGMAVIRTKALSLSAIGSYAELDGQRSLFLYAVLNRAIGGPAFFFVTGLAAGFGYNRALRMPALGQVASFPLVADAMAGGAAPPPAGGAAQRTLLAAKVSALRDYVPVQAGENFFAVGVRFTSWKLIDSFALLSVRTGQHVEVDVLGLSTAIIPSPQSGSTAPPLAEVQLALHATWLPEEGFLGVAGQLTPASYLFSRDCHLTGGFAFYSWFSGPHAGDVVLTVGGYHPHYLPPAHYPRVPRLAFNWQVTPELSLKGDAYFALTAHALMAGGRLQATWQSGPFRAWFNAGADFLLAWKPYHYEARMYVNVGASYTFEFFGTHEITAEVGADVTLWGPPFSGVATVDLSIVSFTVEFGSPPPPAQPLTWAQFRESFLPADASVCGVSATGGLVRTMPGTGTGEQWIVNPKELVLTTSSVIPATAARRNDVPVAVTATSIGIGPMQVGQGAATSTHGIFLTLNDVDATALFAFTPVRKKAPMALWGGTLQPELNGASWIDDTLAGFEIRPATPTVAGATHAIERENLQYETLALSTPVASYAITGFAEGTDQGTTYLRGALASDATVTARNAILQGLGMDPALFVVDLDGSAADDFLFAPRVGTVAEW
jgi:hypothetical protein